MPAARKPLTSSGYSYVAKRASFAPSQRPVAPARRVRLDKGRVDVERVAQRLDVPLGQPVHDEQPLRVAAAAAARLRS